MSVKVNHLTKVFGLQKAVDDLSFEANKGEILGFLGPNGAGKSTTMKMITGYLQASQGEISVCGIPVEHGSLEARKKIGYLAESNPLYYDMYVKEYLQFVAELHQLDHPKNRISDMIELTGLNHEQGKLIGSLSKGYKQRVGLAQALIHDPEVIILDEPTSGLDMNQLVGIRALIKDLGKSRTVIFSTHIMQEVQMLCDRVLIINNGKMVADDPIESLQNRIKGENLIHVKFLNTGFDLRSFEQIAGVKKIKVEDTSLSIFTDSTKDLRPEIFRIAAAQDWVIIEMNLEKLSVEYIFQKLTTEEANV